MDEPRTMMLAGMLRNMLMNQVEYEHSGHICAAAVNRLLDCRDVQRPLADEQRRVNESEEL